MMLEDRKPNKRNNDEQIGRIAVTDGEFETSSTRE